MLVPADACVWTSAHALCILPERLLGRNRATRCGALGVGPVLYGTTESSDGQACTQPASAVPSIGPSVVPNGTERIAVLDGRSETDRNCKLPESHDSGSFESGAFGHSAISP
jgi:hypothetical protein